MKCSKFNFTQGGKRVLQIPAPMWRILLQNKRFDGIRLFPKPKPNPDQSYTVKLTVAQWNIFQENMKKPPVAVLAGPKPAKPSGKEPESADSGVEPEKPEERPKGKSIDEFTVTEDPSTFWLLK